MVTSNPVFQVLVPSGNQNLLAKDQRITALAPGQLGFFNWHSNLSVDATSPTTELRDVYLAIGIGSTNGGTGGTLVDVKKSAGQMIQTNHGSSITIKGANDALPGIYEIAGFTAKCETD